MANPKVRQFAGDFRMWRKAADGTLTPVIPEPADPFGNQPIETSSFNFGYEAGDEVTVKSKRRDSAYNQPIYSDQQPGVTSLSIGLLELPNAILARILRGEAANAAMVAGTVTDEAHTVSSLAVPIRLAHKYVSTVVVTKGGSPLVANTDYTVDLRRGHVMPKASGDIAVNDALTISYAYAGVDGAKIEGGAIPQESFYITGDMQDRISGENGELEVFEARLGVEDDIDWLSAEPLAPVLTGNLIVPNGAPAPYVFETYKQVA
ncbi:phage tail tube protein [Luteimonas notoginsengisoli]|uniref:Minor tail protein n=1 Tax=Luteimonas notoginsengisoli TaxID=1578200 RepID=A0ABV7UQJ6_9GAMM